MAGIENFSPKARQVLSMAQKHAERLQKPQISTEHLLIALIELEGSVASRVLRELGLETDRVSALVEKELGIIVQAGQSNQKMFSSNEFLPFFAGFFNGKGHDLLQSR